MPKYFISWFSGNYSDEGCTEPSFKVWITHKEKRRKSGIGWFDENGLPKEDSTIVTLIEAESEENVWKLIAKYYPDYTKRFIYPIEEDWKKPDYMST